MMNASSLHKREMAHPITQHCSKTMPDVATWYFLCWKRDQTTDTTAAKSSLFLQDHPLTYFSVGLQSGLQLLWFCAVGKRHLQANFSGNSLEVAVCALQARKRKYSQCASPFRPTTILYKWETGNVMAWGSNSRLHHLFLNSCTNYRLGASPPYTSSMQTIPSPAFSMWVMVTVAASPEARARPSGGKAQNQKTFYTFHPSWLLI